jgi:ferrochelatase
MEVLYDLDQEARGLCDSLGLAMVRSRTVGTHRGFVRVVRELICERMAHTPTDERKVVGQYGPSHDTCPDDCCLPPTRPAATSASRP